MQTIPTPAHWCAVQTLQAIRDRHQPGTFEFEVADHAINLVISGTRPPGPFLLRNAYRDARSVMIRRKRRDREFLPLDEDTCGEYRHEVHSLWYSAHTCPERRVIYLDAYERLKLHVSNSNKLAAPCLDCWHAGDTLDETASRLAISREYVKKLRGSIRKAAKSRLPELGSAA